MFEISEANTVAAACCKSAIAATPLTGGPLQGLATPDIVREPATAGSLLRHGSSGAANQGYATAAPAAIAAIPLALPPPLQQQQQQHQSMPQAPPPPPPGLGGIASYSEPLHVRLGGSPRAQAGFLAGQLLALQSGIAVSCHVPSINSGAAAAALTSRFKQVNVHTVLGGAGDAQGGVVSRGMGGAFLAVS